MSLGRRSKLARVHKGHTPVGATLVDQCPGWSLWLCARLPDAPADLTFYKLVALQPQRKSNYWLVVKAGVAGLQETRDSALLQEHQYDLYVWVADRLSRVRAALASASSAVAHDAAYRIAPV